jgi:multidrug efflux pump subunit AcrB
LHKSIYKFIAIIFEVTKKVKKSKSPKLSLFQKLSLFFFDHIKTSVFIWISILLFGFFSYTTFMQREGFPQVNVPISTVQILYFADDKNTVDQQVTQPILNSIKDDGSVKKTTSNSTNNGAIIVVEHQDGYTSSEGSESVKNKLESSGTKLPESAQVNFGSIDAAKFNNKYDILVGVSAKNATTEELSIKSEEISQSLNEKFEEISSAETIKLVNTATNPVTGKSTTQQTKFDWLGTNINNQFEVNPSIIVGINLEDGTDIISFNKIFKEELSNINQKYSNDGIVVVEAAGFAENIEQQIKSLQKNLLEGLIIVVIVCFLFIGFKSGLVAALAMIITISMSLGIFYLTGISLNTITLFGLVLCLGLIVDDIVIVAESIDRERQRNKDARDSTAISIKKIATASTSGTLTTVLGFAPLLFFGGILGSFIRVLPITIIVSLFVSLFVSLTFVPFMSRFIHKPSGESSSKNNPFMYFRKAVSWLANLISKVILSANTTKRKITYSLLAVIFSLVVLLGSGPLYSKLKFDIFPTPKDSNELQIQFTFAPETTIEEAQEITKTANSKISAKLGDDISKLSYLGEANERQSTVNITLIPIEERETTSKEYLEKLSQELSSVEGADIYVSQVSAGPPKERLPFKVQITADDPAKANQVAKNLVNFLDNKTIERNNGTTAQINKTEYTGELVSITRINGERVVEVKAGFDADDTSALVQATQKAVEDEFITNEDYVLGLNESNFTFDFGSESQNQDSFSTVLISLPILVLVMYLLLAFQFRSFVQPLLILIAVPFSFFGVGLILSSTDNPLSFFTMIGFFALIGISVNNTILLTDFANQKRKEGYSPRQSMAQAIKERFRPLLTTTTTAIAALIPLALSDPFWENLAFTLIGGLISSAVLVIVAFPYYFLILEFFRSRFKVWYTKKRKKSYSSS